VTPLHAGVDLAGVEGCHRPGSVTGRRPFPVPVA